MGLGGLSVIDKSNNLQCRKIPKISVGVCPLMVRKLMLKEDAWLMILIKGV